MWVSSGDGLAYTSLLSSYFHSFDSIFFSLNADVPSFKASNTDVFWELFSQRTKIVRLFHSEHIYENTKELFGNRSEKQGKPRAKTKKVSLLFLQPCGGSRHPLHLLPGRSSSAPEKQHSRKTIRFLTTFCSIGFDCTRFAIFLLP